MCSDVALALMTEAETLEDGEFLMNTLTTSKTPNSFTPTYDPSGYCPNSPNGPPPESFGPNNGNKFKTN
jgi:hypothetical protein